jgi:hypothetical protein
MTMQIKAVTTYPQPSYPNEQEYKQDPGQSYPQISKKAVLLTILALAANDNYNSKSTAQDKPKVGQLEKSNNDSLAQLDTNKSATFVAPVFEHGEGRGAVGCEVIAPPVFISEEDARNIIIEMLAKHGIEFDIKDKAIDSLQFVTNEEGHDYSKSFFDTFDVPTGTKELNLDLFSTKHNLGIEFVSRDDYFDMGGARSSSSVQGYDLKKIAYDASGLLGKHGKFNSAVFYDPVEKIDWNNPDNAFEGLEGNLSDLLEKKNGNKPADTDQSQPDSSSKESPIYKMQRSEYMKGLEELRAQVSDFISWLKDKGILKEQ